jgi:hypothetical protein
MLYPLAAKRCAIERPMPRVPPVMSAMGLEKSMKGNVFGMGIL